VNAADAGRLQPPPARLLTGDEPITGTTSRVRDFWSWTLSDLRGNTVRPMLAEFLVARALGADERPRIEWDAYDVTTPEGLRLEVKSAAYLQAWEQLRLSTITFGGLHARTGSYNADGYVLAVLPATEHAGYDALDVHQWAFWVLPREVLAATGQRSIRLSRVEALAGPALTYSELADHVRKVVSRVL
jgi:hypothetical protein